MKLRQQLKRLLIDDFRVPPVLCHQSIGTKPGQSAVELERRLTSPTGKLTNQGERADAGWRTYAVFGESNHDGR